MAYLLCGQQKRAKVSPEKNKRFFIAGDQRLLYKGVQMLDKEEGEWLYGRMG